MSNENIPEELQQYLDIRGDAEATLNSDRKVVRYFHDWLQENDRGRLLEATTRDVVAYLQHLRQSGGSSGNGLASSTIKSYHTSLRRFYREYTDADGMILDVDDADIYSNNPAAFATDDYVNISSRAEKQRYAENDEGIIYLSPEETRKLRENVPVPKVRNELLVKLMVQTGPRVGEVTSLRLDNLDRERRTVTYNDTKNDQKRTIPYNDLSPELDLWLDEGYRDRFDHATESPYVFVTRQKQRLTKSSVRKIIRETAEEAGIQEVMLTDANGNDQHRVTPHTLRATFIMRCFDAGIPLPKVRKFTGHSDIETLRSYVEAGQSDAEQAYREAELTFES